MGRVIPLKCNEKSYKHSENGHMITFGLLTHLEMFWRENLNRGDIYSCNRGLWVIINEQWWLSGRLSSSWCSGQTRALKLSQWFLWEPENAPEESSHQPVCLVKRMIEAPPLFHLLAPRSAPEERSGLISRQSLFIIIIRLVDSPWRSVSVLQHGSVQEPGIERTVSHQPPAWNKYLMSPCSPSHKAITRNSRIEATWAGRGGQCTHRRSGTV